MNCSIKEQAIAPGLKRDDWTFLYCMRLFIKMPLEGMPTVVDLVFSLLLFVENTTWLDPFLETECGFCALTTSSHVRFVESVL